VINQKMPEEVSLKIGLLGTMSMVAAWTSWHLWHPGGRGIAGIPLIVFPPFSIISVPLHNRRKYLR
jgi:hypothetical protein